MIVRTLIDSDLPAVLAIYQEGLDSGRASFEVEAPDSGTWRKKYLSHSRLVCLDGDRVVGWAALTPVSSRECYRGVAEVSIYVRGTDAGKGAGGLLMDRLISSSEAHGIWSLFASVFPENEPSIRLHQKFGFRRLGVRERIAQRDGVWRDTLMLERRSPVVGLD